MPGIVEWQLTKPNYNKVPSIYLPTYRGYLPALVGYLRVHTEHAEHVQIVTLE